MYTHTCSGSSEGEHSKGGGARKKAAVGGGDETERKHLALQVRKSADSWKVVLLSSRMDGGSRWIKVGNKSWLQGC